MAVDKIIQCCEKAIRNGTNLKELYTRFKALVDVNGGIFYSLQIKGNLQNSPNLYAIIKFKEENDGSRLTINSIDKCTKFKFQYLPSDWTCENNQFYGLYEIEREVEDLTKKGLTFEQFKMFYLALNRDLTCCEYSKVIKQLIAQFKLQKDFK